MNYFVVFFLIWQVNRKNGTRLSALGETFYVTNKKYILCKISTFIKIWKMCLFHGIKADSFIWIHVYCIYRFKNMLYKTMRNLILTEYVLLLSISFVHQYTYIYINYTIRWLYTVISFVSFRQVTCNTRTRLSAFWICREYLFIFKYVVHLYTQERVYTKWQTKNNYPCIHLYIVSRILCPYQMSCIEDLYVRV